MHCVSGARIIQTYSKLQAKKTTWNKHSESACVKRMSASKFNWARKFFTRKKANGVRNYHNLAQKGNFMT